MVSGLCLACKLHLQQPDRRGQIVLPPMVGNRRSWCKPATEVSNILQHFVLVGRMFLISDFETRFEIETILARIFGNSIYCLFIE